MNRKLHTIFGKEWRTPLLVPIIITIALSGSCKGTPDSPVSTKSVRIESGLFALLRTMDDKTLESAVISDRYSAHALWKNASDLVTEGSKIEQQENSKLSTTSWLRITNSNGKSVFFLLDDEANYEGKRIRTKGNKGLYQKALRSLINHSNMKWDKSAYYSEFTNQDEKKKLLEQMVNLPSTKGSDPKVKETGD